VNDNPSSSSREGRTQQEHNDFSEQQSFQIYKVLLEIKGAQSATNQMLESHIDAFNRHAADNEGNFTKQDIRLTALEVARSKQTGFITAIGVVASVIGAAVTALIEWFRHS